MQTIFQRFSVPFYYPVFFTENLFSVDNQTFVSFMKETNEQKSSVFFVIDQGVYEAHPEIAGQVKQYFSHYKEHLELIGRPMIVVGGEASKNEDKWYHQIIDEVHQLGIDRHSYIAAIGGGAVLDMVGFAAAISHRGIRHIRIPTTVLSQNDSGVGVKNSINAYGKKNFLGTFDPPFAVMNDFKFLTTLDDRDWRAGISEAIKVALIKDAAFFEQIKTLTPRLAARDMEAMKPIIHRCAEMHVQHIGGGDPFEKGSSRPLDFGHWAAHKLEQLSNYQIRHGEAVAIGIALDVVYSHLKGMITEQEMREVLEVIVGLGFDLYAKELGHQHPTGHYTLLKGLREFREHLGGQLTIMLLEKIGKGVEVHEMDENLILESIQFLKGAMDKLPLLPSEIR